MNKYDIARGIPSDFALAVAQGLVPGVLGVHKFGHAPKGIQTTLTDIWSRANATPTQQIWLAPTAARIHTIKSSSASDVATGVGATTVVVSYLPDWDSLEQTEIVSGDLNTGIAMNSAAVIIHRMKVVPQASSTSTNVGTITATAATDATITAVILPGEGQTEMAIYGVPSVQDLYLTRFQGQIAKASGVAADADFSIRVNPNPNVQTTTFLVKDDISVQTTGTGSVTNVYKYYQKFSGPCIIKAQGLASSADVDGFASFAGFLTLK